MFLLLFFVFVSATSAVFRNSNRCFYKTIGLRGHEAVGLARNVSIVSSQAECFMQCIVVNKCRYLAYNNKTRRCSMNPYLGSKISLSSEVLGFAFRKVCLDDFFEGEPFLRDSPINGDSCYQKTPGKVLIGVVDQLVQDISSAEQCEQLCSTVNADSAGACKSVMYYPKEKECIVAAQNRKDMPELFTDDRNAIYIENLCLGGRAEPAGNTDNLSEKLNVRPLVAEPKDYGSEDPFDANKNAPPVHIESSGYDSGAQIPSVAPRPPILPPSSLPPLVNPHIVNPHGSVSTHSESKVDLAPVIEPKEIDTYSVNQKKTGISTNDLQSYRRRLRDPRINKCFSQIFAKDVVNERVVRSHSLEQCIDICRLCERCLRGRKCNRVAFSM
ncbi:hypothetical protein L596_011499 [Steinernema carpocapsae]|uniref:Apple domain-containing protein n=1 Tax=Steinernema carpocapsae TaxID=34508 RepID=A0A4U5NUV4_STECR|nr:hypothetical protein L596_011499 [Steinernema carpocapsae]